MTKETQFYSNASLPKDEILRKVSLENDKQNVSPQVNNETEVKMPESNEKK